MRVHVSAILGLACARIRLTIADPAYSNAVYGGFSVIRTSTLT